MSSSRNQQDILLGFHSIDQALETGNRQCHKIIVEKGKSGGRLNDLLQRVRELNIPWETLPRESFRKKYGPAAKQGVAGHFSPMKTLSLDELVEQAFRKKDHPVLVLLDNIQDPQNLGALIRSAHVLGVDGLILPSRRSVPLNETVARCSAGAIESLPIATVTNLVQAAETLKQSRFWVVGLDMAGEGPCHEFKFDVPVALVVGGEEKGIRPLLKKTCDHTVFIPMEGDLGSLNAATAGAIVFYEIHKQKNSGKS